MKKPTNKTEGANPETGTETTEGVVAGSVEAAEGAVADPVETAESAVGGHVDAAEGISEPDASPSPEREMTETDRIIRNMGLPHDHPNYLR